MPDRADAHIHVFEHGYAEGFTARPGVRIDEGAVYTSLAGQHDVRRALVVGYEGEAWAGSNNAYIARLARQYAWMCPLAFVRPASLTTAGLDALEDQGFMGISMYLVQAADLPPLPDVDDTAWSWLARRRWPISLNSCCPFLAAWAGILERHPDLRLVVSHLGQPKRVARPPSAGEAAEALAGLLALARHPGPRVKLSGFYSITLPGHAYPHRAAWPYVEALAGAFGTGRLLWGSDFIPCLDDLTFPQTYSMFAEMPFLGPRDLEAIEGGNLLAMIEDVSVET
jgi:predicted TIM-barrel fold metal-dependent hydrolase